MRAAAISAIAGFAMAAGFVGAELTDPRRILGFLDFTGAWDPVPLVVLATAAAVFAAGHPLVARRSPAASAPIRLAIDRRLLLGASLFGVGWGLTGLCPGPALTALPTGAPEVALFVLAMLGGLGMHALLARARAAPGATARRGSG